jgi:CheY-like chemotaxis protein
MSADTRTIDDSLNIMMILQRLCLAGMKVTLACRENRSQFQILFQDPDRIFINMVAKDVETWGLIMDEKVSLLFEDRGFRYESVVEFAGSVEQEGIRCATFTVPRSLRRADDHKLAVFAPEVAPKVTFSNSRSALLDGQIRGLGKDGFEMSLRDPSQKIQDVLRMGEESTLDLALEDNLMITATARVAYFVENHVGMLFTDKVDKTVLGQYRNWLAVQQKLQAERDRESFEASANHVPGKGPNMAALPQVRRWVDRQPTILVLTEKEDFARRMAEALGRKFGVLSLDYITGQLRPFLQTAGAGEKDWGHISLIIIHNHLRLVSPLELSRQLVEQEKCPVPILLAGTEEDEDLKRNRAMAAGAVEYVPVEPFKILSVLRKLDETIKLFEG